MHLIFTFVLAHVLPSILVECRAAFDADSFNADEEVSIKLYLRYVKCTNSVSNNSFLDFIQEKVRLREFQYSSHKISKTLLRRRTMALPMGAILKC